MDLATLALFVPACFALNMAFGPNNLLSLTHGARAGTGAATLAGTGRLLAFAAMIALAALGLGAVLAASEALFTVLKFAGAAYLVWLGWCILSRAGEAAHALGEGAPPTLAAMARREALVALGNPKAILVFTGFSSQFVDRDAYWSSFAALGLVFLLLECVAILLYALLGAPGRACAPAPLGRLGQPGERGHHDRLWRRARPRAPAGDLMGAARAVRALLGRADRSAP